MESVDRVSVLVSRAVQVSRDRRRLGQLNPVPGLVRAFKIHRASCQSKLL